MLHLSVKVTSVVPSTASNKRVWREELLDLVMSRLNLDAMLIELLLVHVLCNSFCEFMHFYNYYEHHNYSFTSYYDSMPKK